MKVRQLRFVLIVSLTLFLPACASTGNTMAANYNDGYDHAYMAAVEKAAEGRGTQIIWVNPPQAKGRPRADKR